MSYFNFNRLIDKYKSEFSSLTLLEGYYDDAGDFIKGETSVRQIQGAVINFRESKIFRSEGALTSKDKRLFTTEPINLTDIESNAVRDCKVIFDKDVYSVMDETENAKFTGVYSYTLKYVSAFKEYAAANDLTEDLDRLEQRLDGVLEDEKTPTEPEQDENDLLESMLDGTT